MTCKIKWGCVYRCNCLSLSPRPPSISHSYPHLPSLQPSTSHLLPHLMFFTFLNNPTLITNTIINYNLINTGFIHSCKNNTFFTFFIVLASSNWIPTLTLTLLMLLMMKKKLVLALVLIDWDSALLVGPHTLESLT